MQTIRNCLYPLRLAPHWKFHNSDVHRRWANQILGHLPCQRRLQQPYKAVWKIPRILRILRLRVYHKPKKQRSCLIKHALMFLWSKRKVGRHHEPCSKEGNLWFLQQCSLLVKRHELFTGLHHYRSQLSCKDHHDHVDYLDRLLIRNSPASQDH